MSTVPRAGVTACCPTSPAEASRQSVLLLPGTGASGERQRSPDKPEASAGRCLPPPNASPAAWTGLTMPLGGSRDGCSFLGDSWEPTVSAPCWFLLCSRQGGLSKFPDPKNFNHVPRLTRCQHSSCSWCFYFILVTSDTAHISCRGEGNLCQVWGCFSHVAGFELLI